MNALIIAAGIVVQTSAPPLSPEDAVRVLLSSTSPARFSVLSPAPPSVTVPYVPGQGPFGPFPVARPMRRRNPVLTFRLPRKGGR